MADEEITDSDKIKIVSNFIISAPPGEFNEVFNDVRILLANDQLLKEEATNAFADYNKEQFTPCVVSNATEKVLITKHGICDSDSTGSTFFDPRTKQTFRYDHLRKEGTEFAVMDVDGEVEPWRFALEESLTEYVKDHFPSGICTVYGVKQDDNTIKLTGCIESHKFQPSNFWNGRWRSEWVVTFPASGGTANLEGWLKLQVHYYEDGNVQLVSSKDIKHEIPNFSDAKSLAAEVCKQVYTSENTYQVAISENYTVMSDTTFKALRRQLPITRTKLDWNKLLSYRVGSELKNT